MPIYAYKCDACGHAKDVLQKMSDPQLTQCPACGQATFKKQLTAAGFQLKGSGWYVTDFREGGGKSSAPAIDGKIGTKEAATESSSSPSATSVTANVSSSSPTPSPAAVPTTSTAAKVSNNS